MLGDRDWRDWLMWDMLVGTSTPVGLSCLVQPQPLDLNLLLF